MRRGKGELDAAIEALHRKWGAKAVQIGGQAEARTFLSTGFATLDRLLGGGLPRGRITHLLGQPTSGITTLALMAAAEMQRAGGVVVYIDSTSTFDPEYAASCGVSLADLLLVRPDTPGTALDILFNGVATRIPGLVILNSPDVLPGLAAVLKRLHFQLEGWLYQGRDVCGYRVRATLLKHPSLPPDSFVDLDIRTAGGRP